MTRLTDREAGEALAKIQFHEVRESSIQRAEKAYLNFLIILDIGQEEESRYLQLDNLLWQKISMQNGSQHFDSDSPELQLANQLDHRRLRLEALVRAIYEAASVVVGILCAELLRNAAIFDSSLKKLARGNPELLGKIDESVVVQAWSVTEYRNKLIAHHDFCRSYGFKSSQDGCRMCPRGPGFFPRLTADHVADTERLWGIYAKSTTKPDEVNIHEKRSLLFHTIPVIRHGSFNQDRREIDALVEKYGIDSATLPEIGNAIRSFTLAMASVL